MARGVENQAGIGQPPLTIRERTISFISEHSFKLLKGLIPEFYETELGMIKFDPLDIRSRPEPYNTGDREDALMKIEFVGDIHGQSLSKEHYPVGSLAAMSSILEAHKKLRLKAARTFTTMASSSDMQGSPYWNMRSLRRDKNGKPIIGGNGVNYAARALLGEVVLSKPDYSAEIHDEEVRGLIRQVFSRP